MADASRSEVDSAELAVVAALDWQSSPASRQQATVYLESVSLLGSNRFWWIANGSLVLNSRIISLHFRHVNTGSFESGSCN